MNAKRIFWLVVSATLLFANVASLSVFQPVETVIHMNTPWEFIPGITPLDDDRLVVMVDTLEEIGGEIRIYNRNDLVNPVVSMNTTSNPRAIATGDFDGNGFQDIALLSAGPVIGIYMYWGQPDGTFQQTSTYPVDEMWSIVSFKQQGKTWLAATVRDFVQVYSWESNHLVHIQDVPSARPEQIAAGDLDNDGDPDLLVSLIGVDSPGAKILWNNNGVFSSGPSFPRLEGHMPTSIGIIPDINQVSILLGYPRKDILEAYTWSGNNGFIKTASLSGFTNVSGNIVSGTICNKTIVVVRKDLATSIVWFQYQNGQLTNRTEEPVATDYVSGPTPNMFLIDGYYMGGHAGLQYLAAADCEIEHPSVEISVTGQTSVTAFDPLEWNLQVKNTGDVGLTNVVISNTIPVEVGGTVNSWSISNLEVGAVWTVTVSADRIQILNNRYLTDTLIVKTDQISETQSIWVTEFDARGLGLQAVLDIPSETIRGETLPVAIWYEVVPDPNSSYNPFAPIIEAFGMNSCFNHSTLRLKWIETWNSFEAVPIDTKSCKPGEYTGSLHVLQNSQAVAKTTTQFFIVEQLKKLFFPIILR